MHWRRNRHRDRRFSAGSRLARRRGRGGGYRLWRSRVKRKRKKGRYFRVSVGLRRGKLRLRELRSRWRYPAAAASLRPRHRRCYQRSRKHGFRTVLERTWGRNPLHGFRVPLRLYHYWWRRDCHSS